MSDELRQYEQAHISADDWLSKDLKIKFGAVRGNEEGGYEIANTSKRTSGRFAGSVEKPPDNLPSPLE